MGNEISSLTNRFTSVIVLWAKESYIRIALVLFISYVLLFPLAQYFQDLIKKIPYWYLLTSFTNFIYETLSLKDLILLLVLLLLLLGYLFLWRKFTETINIEDEFKYELTNWSIPLYSSWVRQKCKDYWGNMLRIKNSKFPGTLKGAYSWYDYEMSFSAKMDSVDQQKGFGFAVRIEDSSNAIIFQITNNKFIPFLLYNGTLIRDTDNEEDLPVILDENEWSRVKVLVKGNIVEINIRGSNKFIYKIPAESFNVPNILMAGFSNPNLSELRQKHQEQRAKLSQLLDRDTQINKMPEGPDKEVAKQQWNNDLSQLPQTTRITFDYQKGSVGLRTDDNQVSYYRKLTVKKI